MPLKIENRSKITLIICCFAYACIYTGRMNLSIATPLFQNNGVLDKIEIGILGSAFFGVYAFGRILNGYSGDKRSPRLLMTISLCGAGLCNIFFSIMSQFTGMLLLWAANGFFQSILWGPTLKAVALTYGEKSKKKGAVMILSSSVGIGSILAIGIATFNANVSVQMVFLIPGIIMVCMGIVVWLFLSVEKQLDEQKIPPLCFRKMLKSTNLFNILVPAAIHGMIKDNLVLWVPLLFIEMFDLNVASAAIYIFMMPIATLFGRLMFPFLYKAFKQRELSVASFSFLLCAVSLVPFVIWKPSLILATLLLILVASFTSMINASFLSIYPLHFQKSDQISTVSGIIDFATYAGSAIGSAIFGMLIYSLGYSSMIFVWVLLCFISVLICIFAEIKKVKNSYNIS